MTNRPDREWISALKQNDPDAHHDLQQLLATWGATLAYHYRVAAYILEEPIDEAYVRIIRRGIVQFRFDSTFFSYCRRILTNEVNRYMNKSRREWEILEPDQLEPSDPPVPDMSGQVIVADQLAACLERLPGQERLIIERLYGEGLSPEEVAEALGMTRNYVNVIACRARKRLRQCMQE